MSENDKNQISYHKTHLEFIHINYATQNVIVDLLSEILAQQGNDNIIDIRSTVDKNMNKYLKQAQKISEENLEGN